MSDSYWRNNEGKAHQFNCHFCQSIVWDQDFSKNWVFSFYDSRANKIAAKFWYFIPKCGPQSFFFKIRAVQVF